MMAAALWHQHQLNAQDRFELVSFDLDGTLVDTAVEIVAACNLALADFDVAARAHDDVVSCIGHGTRELVLQQLARVLIAQPALAARLPFDAVYARFQHHYAMTSGTTGQPYVGCIEALQLLDRAGVACVCVTNKEERFARQVLDGTGLAGFFGSVVGGDTLAYKKPDRRVLEHVLAAHGVPARLAGHVGDSSIDVATARNSGVAAWAVPYGYNAGVPVADSAPDGLFARLDELAAGIASGLLRPAVARVFIED
jgi:phosphoglycolate phosphatase